MFSIKKILARRYTHKRLFQCVVIWALISSILLLTTSLSYFCYTSDSPDCNGGGGRIDLSRNYFQSIDDIFSRGFLVRNEKCSIPDLDAWNSDVMPFINRGPLFNCRNKKYFNLTYTANQSLLINEDVSSSYGYQLDDIRCCYKMIERIQQSKENYDTSADNQYRYSKECYPMKKVTKPLSGFVKVFCRSTFWFDWLRYENFHLIAIFPDDIDASSPAANKLKFWKDYKTYLSRRNQKQNNYLALDTEYDAVNHSVYEKIVENGGEPPNVLIFGLDSTSRMNFHRFMHRTMNVMKKQFFVEMNGYTKVGQNTFPNIVPFLTSYSETELIDVCYPNRWHPQDDCPYIWRKFAENNYVTALLEDSPTVAIFNYLKTGFVLPPVDMYIRPFMQAAFNEMSDDCINYERPEEIINKYIVDLATLADSKGVPYFILSWLTDLTHEYPNNLQSIDNLLADTLLTLHQRGLLKNTLVFVMGDHGYRYLGVRRTSSGWFEDKLPALWIKLPEKMSESNPAYTEALKLNSKQLTTPFDMHEILKDILRLYGISTKELFLESSQKQSERDLDLRGLNPLRNVPDRSCDEAGIPDEYCACTLPVEYKSSLSFIQLAAETVTNKINLELPRQCHPLSIATIIGSGVYHSTSSDLATVKDQKNNVASDDEFPDRIIVAFKTTPGDFMFEAIVNYDMNSKTFDNVTDILRTNKIKRSTFCLSKNEKSSFEALCYCSLNLIKILTK